MSNPTCTTNAELIRNEAPALHQMLTELGISTTAEELTLTQDQLLKLAKELRERAAVISWSTGMQMHMRHKSAHDSREVGSHCASTIRQTLLG